MQDLVLGDRDRDRHQHQENINECSLSSDQESQSQQDPNMAAELLRQKIEETNQKISDYFRQQQRLAASQTKQQL